MARSGARCFGVCVADKALRASPKLPSKQIWFRTGPFCDATDQKAYQRT